MAPFVFRRILVQYGGNYGIEFLRAYRVPWDARFYRSTPSRFYADPGFDGKGDAGVPRLPGMRRPLLAFC